MSKIYQIYIELVLPLSISVKKVKIFKYIIKQKKVDRINNLPFILKLRFPNKFQEI